MCTGKKCVGYWVSLVLVVVGGLNWGIYGAFNYNVVEKLLGAWPMAVKVVYVLVGLAAIMMVVGCRCGTCTTCECKSEK